MPVQNMCAYRVVLLCKERVSGPGPADIEALAAEQVHGGPGPLPHALQPLLRHTTQCIFELFILLILPLRTQPYTESFHLTSKF